MSLFDFEGPSGDEPDTFDERLAVITRLIDTLGDEVDEARRRQRISLAMRLIGELSRYAATRIIAQADRLELL